MAKKPQSYIYNPEYECMSRSGLENLQSERLKKLVERVYNTVAPYRAKMDAIGLKPSDIKSVKDLSKLPFTVKHDLRENYPFGMFSAPKSDIVRIHASSGTTGKLTVAPLTQNDIEVWSEVTARSLASAGVTKDSTVHIAYGYGLFTGGLGAHYGAEKIGATVVPASSGNTKRQLMLMKDLQATHICCTPSYAIFLATELENNGMTIDDLGLQAGVFGAEPWSESMRKEIEKRLKLKAFDIYGLSEIIGPGVACECQFQNGSHIQEDHFIPEIIDPDTLEPVPYGQKGELVFTTITKTGQPLVRYRTRDITSLTIDKCECGRTTARMGRVVGRTDDMLIIRGVNVFPSQIETAIMNVSGVEPHYIIKVDRVNNSDMIEIDVEVGENMISDTVGSLESLKKRIEQELNSYIGISAIVKLVEPHTIPRSEGKAVRVIDNRKI